MTQPDLERAFGRACALDVAVLKPGNVSSASPGHGMEAAQFIASAAAAGPALCAAGAPVGRRILEAVLATRSVVDCNTNLGILLLCAPLAAAGEAIEAAAVDERLRQLRDQVQRQLHALTVDDARHAFKAIALANPGGLGAAEAQDVRGEATVSLLDAMRLAADRDVIARQYANGYAEVFDVGLAAWCDAAEAGDARLRELRMQHAYLALLAHCPDSHIVRKHGEEAAREVAQEAAGWRARIREDALAAQEGLAQWDRRLKRAGLNPGTSADLAVATAFIAEMAFSQSGRGHTVAG